MASDIAVGIAALAAAKKDDQVKRKERLRDAPIAVTAIASAALETRGA